MKVYIPSNLNLGAEKHSDKFCYIITQLYYSRIFDKRFTLDSFVPLRAKILIKMLGGRYKKYLSHLIKKKIIETDNHYIPGEKSKGYRFTQKYRNVRFKKVEIEDEKLIKKIEEHKSNLEKQSVTNSTYQYLYHCLQNVSVDYSGACKYVQQNITELEKYISYNISIDLLHSKDYFFVVDSTAGRVHTNVSNLAKGLRTFLQYDNQKLVEIDIANSQPFLFNLLIYEYFKSNYLSYGNQNEIGVSCNSKDVLKYRELTSNGTFYEYLMDKLQTNEDRSQFKVTVFKTIFYCQENPGYVKKERKKFKELFPTVSKIIAYYKKDNYKNLAIKLQKAEADIMINNVVPKLAEKGIYLLTIHDSILTTQDNTAIVKKVILDEFKNKFNLVPTVRIK